MDRPTCTAFRPDGDFCHQGRDTEIAKKLLKLSKYTDVTIHWKALEEHFLMVYQLVFQFNHFGEMLFLNFSKKHLSP
jgi:hypothetical protein